jgi:hypothetical protein
MPAILSGGSVAAPARPQLPWQLQKSGKTSGVDGA